ncbi:unnamed protein product [Urochloa humidicola]
MATGNWEGDFAGDGGVSSTEGMAATMARHTGGSATGPEVLLFQPRAHDDSLVERAKRLRAGDHGAPALGRRGRPR